MSSRSINEAVVLAGGLGTRLSPLTKYRPKSLVPIGNYTMLDWNFFMLAKNGIKRAVIVVNYLGDQIRDHIDNISSKLHPTIEIIVPEVNSNGTADALRVVSEEVKSDNFFVTMSDIITNINLKEMGSFHIRKNGIATISLKPMLEYPKQFGVILVDEKCKILRFLEKPSAEELFLTKMIVQSQSFNYQTNLVNSGIYCFKKQILNILEGARELLDFGKNVFPYLLKRKLGIYGYKGEADYYWQDCGRPEQVLGTNLEILKRGNLPFFPKGKEEDGSWFGANHKCRDVLIKHPVAIGNNVEIESGSTAHLSSINDQCKIGRNCTICKSLIWENVHIGDNVTIRDSIISDNVTIGDNCVIVDETIIPPGYKIPPNTYIKKGRLISDLTSKEYAELIS